MYTCVSGSTLLRNNTSQLFPQSCMFGLVADEHISKMYAIGCVITRRWAHQQSEKIALLHIIINRANIALREP